MKELIVVLLTLHSPDGSIETKKVVDTVDSQYFTCSDFKNEVVNPIVDGLKIKYEKVEVLISCS